MQASRYAHPCDVLLKANEQTDGPAMRGLLVLLLLFGAGSASALDLSVPPPARLQAADVDAAMPGLARLTLARLSQGDEQQLLDTRFRLQIVAGQYPQALESIRKLRALRGDSTQQPPLYLQYEIYARAKQLQLAQRINFADAWKRSFADNFQRLDDPTALKAEFAFGTNLQRLREQRDRLVDATESVAALNDEQAVALLRAWQVHRAYAEFLPLAPQAINEDDARRYSIDRNISITTRDGARISAISMHPAKATKLPVLLTFTIYANDDWAWMDAKTMAAHGYGSVVAYSRGKGRSPDPIRPYDHDGSDAAAVIAWAAALPWSNGKVGMYGGSYSGFTQWAALKRGAPALKAIATSATTAPGIDVPMEGGIFLNFIYPWPLYTTNNTSLDDATYGDSGRWNALNSRWYQSGQPYRELPKLDGTANPLFEQWLQHPTYDAYWQAMIPQGREFAEIGIPVLATTGYFDGAQIGALHYFREHLKQRPDADHTLLIGPYEHFTMQTGVPEQVQGYSPDPVARIDLQALRLAWFDHVLKGTAKPALLSDRVNWQVMGSNLWRHAATLEAMPTRQQRLYLVPGNDGNQQLAAEAAPARSSLQRVDFRDRSDAGWQAPRDVINRTLDPHAGLVFRSEPLARETELAGAFSGMLDFSLNKRDADVALAIYELTADGQYLDLAYWLQRLSHAQDPSQRQLLAPSQRHRVRVANTRLIGRKLSAGSRVVVTLGVIKQPDRQLNLGSGKDPSDETLADAGTPLEIRWYGSSHIDLPVRD